MSQPSPTVPESVPARPQPIPAEHETASNEADRSNYEANYPDGTAPSSGPRVPKGPGRI
ncbi:hypothetical protein [Chitiniphilus shinanonensis]|uniref:hypothetical protein n=1 Tax=Chitiniphilus shinanonensis TaxID=553088 RepID=UPI00306FDA2C